MDRISDQDTSLHIQFLTMRFVHWARFLVVKQIWLFLLSLTFSTLVRKEVWKRIEGHK